MDLTSWFLRRPGLFARAQPKPVLEDMAWDRPSVHSNASTLSISWPLTRGAPHICLWNTLCIHLGLSCLCWVLGSPGVLLVSSQLPPGLSFSAMSWQCTPQSELWTQCNPEPLGSHLLKFYKEWDFYLKTFGVCSSRAFLLLPLQTISSAQPQSWKQRRWPFLVEAELWTPPTQLSKPRA